MSQDPYNVYRTTARVGGVILLLLGTLVLLGWLWKIELLTTFLPGRITMKPNTAIGFLFLGLALFLLTRYSKARSTQLWCAASATVVILVGLVTLSEYLFHADLGIDQLLFKDLAQSPFPGRMAHITAFNFCIAGLSVLLLALSEKRASISQALAATIGLSSIFAIIGYLYGVPVLYGSIEYTSMALHTGIGFLVGSLSVLFCRPDLGLMSVLTNPYPGGWLARKLLPVAALAPAGLGAVCIHSGLFSSDVRLNIACLVVSQMVLFMALVWVLAFVLNRAEGEKATAQEALARSEKLLQQSQKMEAIGLLAGGVAHDFNNLLAVINGYSDLLLERSDLPDPDRRSLEQIKQAGGSAASLTRQLLMLSRQQVVEPVVLNINQTVGNLDKMLRRLIKENIQFSFVLDPQLDRVKADPGQIEQIVLNLVVNARDAMPQEGGTVTIRTSNLVLPQPLPIGTGAIPAGDYVLVEVADTGAGIPKENLVKIFEPFFTTKPVGQGTGLGLSTVYGVVKQTGGFIAVDSDVGRGTTFQIYLPRYAVEGVASEPVEDAERNAKRDVTGQDTILLVEDEDAVRSFAARALRMRGYTVMEASGGEAALDIVRRHQGAIDLLISDVVMPNMDGPTLVRAARRIRPEMRIIYMSGYAEDAFRRNEEKAEELHFLPKPFGLKQLVAKVKDVLSGAPPARTPVSLHDTGT
jgi:signal transduction histidine kinase/ActR/RegA family two-component response regulator